MKNEAFSFYCFMTASSCFKKSQICFDWNIDFSVKAENTFIFSRKIFSYLSQVFRPKKLESLFTWFSLSTLTNYFYNASLAFFIKKCFMIILIGIINFSIIVFLIFYIDLQSFMRKYFYNLKPVKSCE